MLNHLQVGKLPLTAFGTGKSKCFKLRLELFVNVFSPKHVLAVRTPFVFVPVFALLKPFFKALLAKTFLAV